MTHNQVSVVNDVPQNVPQKQDDSVRRGDDLPDPADIADEIIARLSLATSEMQELARLLGEKD